MYYNVPTMKLLTKMLIEEGFLMVNNRRQDKRHMMMINQREGTICYLYAINGDKSL